MTAFSSLNTGSLSSVLQILANGLIPKALILIIVLLTLIIFFINIKKKRGLIYIAVVFILNAFLLFVIGKGISVAIEYAFPAYKDILNPIIGGIGTEFVKIALIYFIAGILCIALFIVFKLIKSNKDKKNKAASDNVTEIPEAAIETLHEETETLEAAYEETSPSEAVNEKAETAETAPSEAVSADTQNQ